jgi:hypothetical protein
MKRIILTIASFAVIVNSACNNCEQSASSEGKLSSLVCTDECQTKSKSGELTCKLTSPELQQRKSTVISNLKAQVIEKKELKNGYAFKFPGNDKMIDELTEFIKTERECCDFFTFNLSISGDKSEAWLELSGDSNVKDFITGELGL